MNSYGTFYIAMAFNEKDEPMLSVGKGGVRAYDTIGKARGQRKRWVNGTRWNNGPVWNQYVNSKVFQMTYVAGVLMAKEVDCG